LVGYREKTAPASANSQLTDSDLSESQQLTANSQRPSAISITFFSRHTTLARMLLVRRQNEKENIEHYKLIYRERRNGDNE